MIQFIKNDKKGAIIVLILTILIYVFLTRDLTIPKKDSSNPHYVNNIYLTDDFVYNKLGEIEKKIYNYIFDIAKRSQFSNELDVNTLGCVDTEECINIIGDMRDAIILDHPEMMNFSSFGGYYKGNKITLHFYPAMPLEIVRDIGGMRIERIIDGIKIKTKNMSDAEKIKYVYEWIGDHATYDRVFMHDSKNQSIFNVFIMHNAVCAGFAKTAQVIFQNIGITSYGALGYMSSDSNVGHMWNVVKLEDKYYYFDSTWAASINDKKNPSYYNGIIQSTFNDYSLNNASWYPEIEKNQMPGVLNN